MTRKTPGRKSPRRETASPPSPGRYAIAPSATGAQRVAAPAPAWASAPTTTTVSATEASRRFSDLLSRACYQGETFVIERGGRAICQLGPVDARRCTGADLLALLARLPRPDDEFLATVERISREQPVVEASPWER